MSEPTSPSRREAGEAAALPLPAALLSWTVALPLLLLLACGPAPGNGTTEDGDDPRAGAVDDGEPVPGDVFATDEQVIQAREGHYDQRGVLGEDSEKIRHAGDSVLVWAGGAESGADAEWFDFTGAPIDPAGLQYGIGADRIESIDDPVFVEPEDPRLLQIPPSPYRPDERPTTNDEIPVIGYMTEAGDARAYPTALLDHHEVVNDLTGKGKPFAVGW